MAVPENPTFDPEKESLATLPKNASEFLQDAQDQIETAAQTLANEVRVLGAGGDRWRGKAGSINPVAAIEDKYGFKFDSGLSTVEGVIDTLTSVVDILSAVLKLVNTFQSDYNNLFKVLEFTIKQLLKQVQELLVSIASTGIYILPVLPETSPLSRNYKPGGGFNAFKAKVNHGLTNAQDPNRPVFFEGDYMGGVAVALSAGTNLGDLVNDLEVLSKFIGGLFDNDKISPVENAQAVPGLYSVERDTSIFNATVGTVIDNTISPKELGIKLTWSEPRDVQDIKFYRIYRSRSLKGSPLLDKDGNHQKTDKRKDGFGFEYKYEYKDYGFNAGSPVFIDVDDIGDLEYLDFEVNYGETYYYRVVPVFKDSEDGLIESKMLSKTVSAKAISCIEDGSFSEFFETPDGLLNGIPKGGAPYWENLSLRDLFGDDFDELFRSLARMVDRLFSVAETSSSHFNQFIDFIKEWLTKLKELVATIRDILEKLRAFKLSASAVSLVIPSEGGGIEGFKDRFNNAVIPEDIKEVIGGEGDLCNIYGGFLLLAGSVTGDSFEKSFRLSEEDMARLQAAGQFENFKKDVEAVKNQYDDFSASSDINRAVELIVSMFQGG
jgi:hypothetical protein